MRTFHGIEALLESHDELPDSGFLYVLHGDDVDSPEGLAESTFVMWETEEEELFLESSEEHSHWLEAPMFADIVDAYQDEDPDASTTDLTRAVLHYWEHDDFLTPG